MTEHVIPTRSEIKLMLQTTCMNELKALDSSVIFNKQWLKIKDARLLTCDDEMMMVLRYA